MNACPSTDELDELALGGGTAELREHAENCPRCGPRLRWLRKEEEIVRRWADQDDASTAHLWKGVQTRLAASRRRPWMLASTCAAALIGGVFFLGRSFHRERMDPEETVSAKAAIDRAELEYGRAIDALEAQVAARDRSNGGKHPAALAQARSGLSRARAASGQEPAGRVRLLEGYAAYLKALRRALREAE